jgi:hypothetical protein
MMALAEVQCRTSAEGQDPPQALGAKVVVPTIDNERMGGGTTTSSVTASINAGVD